MVTATYASHESTSGHTSGQTWWQPSPRSTQQLTFLSEPKSPMPTTCVSLLAASSTRHIDAEWFTKPARAPLPKYDVRAVPVVPSTRHQREGVDWKIAAVAPARCGRDVASKPTGGCDSEYEIAAVAFVPGPIIMAIVSWHWASQSEVDAESAGSTDRTKGTPCCGYGCYMVRMIQPT